MFIWAKIFPQKNTFVYSSMVTHIFHNSYMVNLSRLYNGFHAYFSNAIFLALRFDEHVKLWVINFKGIN